MDRGAHVEGASTIRRVRFGPFELDRRAAELRKYDRRIRLQEQPFQILLMLLEQPGEVVLREEIRKRLWPNDTIVEFDHSINAAIKRLRDALGESAEEPCYVETVARRGYRFIGEVETEPAQPDRPREEPVHAVRLDNEFTGVTGDLTGKTISHYKLLEKLGRGGMGEVYRARDTRLGRDVALKVLPSEFAEDVSRRNRFEREARAVAALNHPNILALFDIGSENGMPYTVTEFIAGETLRASLPPRKAINIAAQVADGLAAAHNAGVTHRDVKPDNVMITADGRAKILDFGLAKVTLQPVGGADEDRTIRPTEPGVVMGTVGYMSPEQVSGAEVDKRSDIFSFGALLYEMLSGKRAFQRDTAVAEMNAILKEDPPELPESTPSGLRDIVAHCLEKKPEHRFQSAQDLAFALRAVGGRSSALEPPANAGGVQGQPVGQRRTLRTTSIGLVAGIILSAIAMWAVIRFTPPQPQPSRFVIVPPPAQSLATQGVERDIAISPDGRQIVYRTGGAQTQLTVRSMDQLEGRTFAGNVSGARGPFISPDGHWVGFFAEAVGELKKVPMSGGPPITLCRISGFPRGASWGPDDTIVFATTNPSTGLLSVPAGGGEPKVLTKPDTTKGEADHLFPFVLPGGRAVLFTVTAMGQSIENAQVAVLDLKTGQRKVLIHGGSQAEYTETGHLVYAVAGTLRAVRFDLAHLEVLSDPVPAVEQVATFNTGAANFAISRSGTLVYVPGGAGGIGAQRSLVWVNRQGREEPVNAPLRAYVYPRISPDGTRVALDVRDQEQDIWIWDLLRQTLTRLTFDPAQDQNPVWSPNGRRVIFTSFRDGSQNLYWQPADNTGTVERLTMSPNQQFPTSMSPDGKHLVFIEITPKNQVDIGVLGMEGKRAADPLIHASFQEANGEISPDGRWIAYESDESGQRQVYVRPFPNVDTGRWQVSTAGGTRPLWARSGRELFYVDASSALMVVSVQTRGQTFSAGSPSKVFDARISTPAGGLARTYDVSPDGQRFLLIKENAANEQASTTAPAGMVVVLNWLEELKQRVPVH